MSSSPVWSPGKRASPSPLSSPLRAANVFVEKDMFERVFDEGDGASFLSVQTSPSKRSASSSRVYSPSSPSSVSSSPTRFSQQSQLQSPSKSQQQQQGAQLATSLQQLFLREKLAQEKTKQEAQIARVCARHVEKKQQNLDMRHHCLSEAYETSRVLLDEVDKELSLINESKATKTRRQYEDWNSNVHGEIVSRIHQKLNATSPKEIHEQKLSDYQKFLDIINRKHTIFRDIIIENEYDPLEVGRRSPAVRVPILKDSTHIDKQKLEAERGRPDKTTRKAKDTLPVETWAEGKIQATPFGRKTKADDDGASRTTAASPSKQSENQRSKVFFNDFSYPTGKEGREQLAREMPRGKAVFAKKIYADPAKAWEMPPEHLAQVLQIRPPE